MTSVDLHHHRQRLCSTDLLGEGSVFEIGWERRPFNAQGHVARRQVSHPELAAVKRRPLAI
jgi:hypothetical protein